MKNIYLIFLNIYIFSIYLSNQFEYVHDDNDINEIFHETLIENLYHRVRRDVGNETTIVYDGSGDTLTVTIIPTTAITVTFQTTVTPVTFQTTVTPVTFQTTVTPTTSVSTTTQTSLSTTFRTCNPSTEIELFFNSACVSKTDAQIYAVNLLRNRTGNATIIAYALSYYISSITSTNISTNPNYILSPNEIDEFVGSMNNINLATNSNTSFIISQQPNQYTNGITLGASFIRGMGGDIVNNSNNTILSSNPTAAAVFNNQSFSGISSVNMLIIDQPITYENIDNSSNKKLVSSVIVVAIQKNNSASISTNISLYFRVLDEYRPSVNAKYLCSFYDTNSAKWNESGCTAPERISESDRYKCSCNHLTTFALLWIPNNISCNVLTEVLLSNGTCISKTDAQILAVNTLRSNSSNSTIVANALSTYVSSITTLNPTLNSSYTLSLQEVDGHLSSIKNVNLSINTNDSFLIAKSPFQDNNVIILGATFTRGTGGAIVNTTNQNDVIDKSLSAAANVSKESLTGVISLNMLIIDKPLAFRNVDNSSNKSLASSVILATIERNTSEASPINISLYFQVLDEFRPNVSATYLCSFYDTNNRTWSESGCTTPQFNPQHDRYECSCNHLTSFALIWLPQSLSTSKTQTLNAQDIASLVCQSVSILSFLAIIIHAIYIRIRKPFISSTAYNLLPLISGASTTILFIFYIALGMTVYTQTSSADESKCFLSSSVLMFFVYFFLIFMFCIKTCIGYFNYLRFVCLFPPPPHRKLVIILCISFFISIAWVAFAAGFNSNSSFKITQLYPYKLCWFTHDVIYFFLTIPACLFLLINITIFILVSIRIINHARNSSSPHPSYDRMKQCVIVLLSSCVTQGIGWLFGPFISFINPTAGDVLGWFFIIFNGLEGVWSIVLYGIVRSQQMDVPVRFQRTKESLTQEQRIFERIEIPSEENNIEKNDDVIDRLDEDREESDLNDDLRFSKSIGSRNNEDPITYF